MPSSATPNPGQKQSPPSVSTSAESNKGTSSSSTFSNMNAVSSSDVESIGAHCQYKYCHQLDFLPFRCESCRGTFCLDHRTETGHECAQAGAWAARRNNGGNDQNQRPVVSTAANSGKPTLANGTQCSHPACKTFINTHSAVGVSCAECNRSYCLKHRLREDHDCAKLTPLVRPGAGSGSASNAASATINAGADKAKAALSRLRAWGKEKQASSAAASGANKTQTSTTSSISSFATKKTGRGGSAAAAAAALNTLKRTAKGDSNVPQEKRIYLTVEAEAAPAQSSPPAPSTTANKPPPSGAFFYTSDWTVGRMLDSAARSLRIENLNNRSEGEEATLRVFHVGKGKVLGFGEKLGQCCSSGDTVVLLRGIGAPPPPPSS